jgi:alpha-tubulin suppressor-like RCC1 family protein
VTMNEVAFCWGHNSSGQLGDGTHTTRLVPTRVLTDLRFIAAPAGDAHTCALTPDHRAYCWGDNVSGELGDGSFTSRAVPGAVTGSRSFTVLNSPGQNEHNCGVTGVGSLFCWGLNNYGQIGDGTSTNRPAPVKVSGSI